MRILRALAGVAVALSLLTGQATARGATAHPGSVTYSEYVRASIEMTRHHVQHDLWNATGARIAAWHGHRLKWYPTTQTNQHVEATWVSRPGADRFRLDDLSWCTPGHCTPAP